MVSLDNCHELLACNANKKTAAIRKKRSYLKARGWPGKLKTRCDWLPTRDTITKVSIMIFFHDDEKHKHIVSNQPTD